jgi:hypothetical protein
MNHKTTLSEQFDYIWICVKETISITLNNHKSQ